MLYGPDTWLASFFMKLGELAGKLPPALTLEAPLTHQRRNPFSEADIVQPLASLPPTIGTKVGDPGNLLSGSGAQKVTSVRNSREEESFPIKNVRASDYITPQKYLDGAEIPSYYSFQSNMIPPEDLVHGMHPFFEVDRR